MPVPNEQMNGHSVLLQNKLGIEDFVWSVDEWSTVNHDDFSGGEDLPVITLTAGEDNDGPETEILCKKMVEASQKWGFFRLLNHGVSREVIERFQEQCIGLFDLPMMQKMKGARSESLPLGYSASNPDYAKNLPWVEIFQILQSPKQLLEFSIKVWGEESQSHKLFSQAVLDYMSAIEDLGMKLLQLLAQGLDLSKDFFTKHCQEKESMMLRVNRYPPCPDPQKILGLGSHTDPHTLTILLQDQVGGLQVLKDDGAWIGVRPIPNSFVVNIGDTLEAWTNGRLKSGIHRAVVNQTKKRFSAAYFMSPSINTVITCPKELVEKDKYPRIYSPFTWGEFRRELLIQKRVRGKTALRRYLLPTHLPAVSL